MLVTFNINCIHERHSNHNWVRHTFQQEYQAEDQALDDICSNKHLTHPSQEPEEQITYIRRQIFQAFTSNIHSINKGLSFTIHET